MSEKKIMKQILILNGGRVLKDFFLIFVLVSSTIFLCSKVQIPLTSLLNKQDTHNIKKLKNSNIHIKKKKNIECIPKV